MMFPFLVDAVLGLVLMTGEASACSVTIEAQGVKGNRGVVGYALFASKEGWPEQVAKAYKDGSQAAAEGTVVLAVNGMKPGPYGVVVLHDENRNKKLDKKPSGRPTEGWAMSNNPKTKLQVPKFESAVAELKCGQRLVVQMRYPTKDQASER